MLPLDVIAIEQHARQLRAQEMQRIGALVSARLGLSIRQFAAHAVSGLTGLNRLARNLLSWNPQARHPF